MRTPTGRKPVSKPVHLHTERVRQRQRENGLVRCANVYRTPNNISNEMCICHTEQTESGWQQCCRFSYVIAIMLCLVLAISNIF